MKRKIFSVFLIATLFVIVLVSTSLAAQAATTASGKCGDNLTWTLDSKGTLTIKGTGDMWAFGWYSTAPWYSYCETVKRITIGDNITSIGSYAFRGCTRLTSLVIPDSVTHIGVSAFYDCTSLTSITVDEDNPYYSSDDRGVLFNKNKTELIRYPIGNVSTSYNIPRSVTSIGYEAFCDCRSLVSIDIPKSVTYIGYEAFHDCSSLTSIDIPDSVKSIGVGAFSSCTSLTSINIPDSVTYISGFTFSDCTSLTSINIPKSVKTIAPTDFGGCTSLTSITVDEDNPYYSSDDRGVLFNKNKTELIRYPIGNVSTSYNIPRSVTSIGYDAFFDCRSLVSIDIPDSVASIGNYAFFDCRSLSTVNYMGAPTKWNKISIGSSNSPLLGANIIFLLEKDSVPFEGAQIRTEGEQGLRYIFKIPKVLSENCLEFGSVVMPKKYLGENALEIGLVTNVNGKNYAAKKVPALKIFGEDDEYIYYTVCITKIKESNYSSEYVAVPYVITKNADGTDRITYGEEQGMTVNEVMSALSE